VSGLAQLPALVVIAPLLTAPLVLLLRPRGLAWLAALVASLAAFTIAAALTASVLDGHTPGYEMGGWPAPYGIGLEVDALSALVLLVVTGASAFALLAGRASIDSQIAPPRQPYFYAAWLLALAGFLGITVSADAFNIFVFMEISSLACYVLIAGGPDRRALPAVFKYLIIGTVAATFYLIGVGLIYMMTGTLALADMESRIEAVADQTPVLVAAGFITIGLALKAAVFPLHVWLPNAYTHAPHIVTVFLAACATKVAIYVLLRFDFFVFQQNLIGHGLQFSFFLLPLAVLAVLIASGAALAESNLKRLLAYSSIAQIGYILMGASLVTNEGLTAGIIHLFNHALAKGALFLAVAGLALGASGLDLKDLRGAAQRHPWTMAAFVAASLSLIGMPGTAGFISKWYLISAAIDQGPLGAVLVVVIVVSSLLALAYVWRVVEPAYFQTREANEVSRASAGASSAPAVAWTAGITWVAVAANFYFGLQPDLPLRLASDAAGLLLGHMR
jgi:multicomponent Na+:H+ antiporter subunit D